MCILFFLFFLSFFLDLFVSTSSFAERRHSLGFAGSFNVAIACAYVMTSKVNAPNGILACVQSSRILPITSMHITVISLILFVGLSLAVVRKLNLILNEHFPLTVITIKSSLISYE